VTDAVKAITGTLSDYADVDFNDDVVQVRITHSVALRLRQHTASFHPEPGSIRQLADGSKNALPIFRRKLLRQGCFDPQERHGRREQQVCPPDSDDLANRTKQVSPQRLSSNSKLCWHRAPTVNDPG